MRRFQTEDRHGLPEAGRSHAVQLHRGEGTFMMRKRFNAMLFFAVAGLWGPLEGVALAVEQADIDRVERKQAARDLARAIFERADKRAKDAVAASPSGKTKTQEQVDAVIELMRACTDLAKAELEAVKEGRSVGITPPSSDCIKDATEALKRDPNAELIAELRAEFIEEELEALRESMEEAAIEEVRSEVEEWAI